MFSYQYIKMCIEGREDIEYIRVFNSTEGGWLGNFTFKKGDFFNHPEMSEEEVREVAQAGKSNLQGFNDPYHYRLEECVWIPTADQLAEEAQKIPWALHEDVAKNYYRLKNHVLSSLSDEEQVLSYWMEKKYGKIWDFDNHKWIR